MSLANRMALASPQVRAVCVEANEFPYLSNQFRVRGVPEKPLPAARIAQFMLGFPERLPEGIGAVLRFRASAPA